MKFKASWSIEIEADSNAEALVKAMTIGNRSTKEPIRTTLSVLPKGVDRDEFCQDCGRSTARITGGVNDQYDKAQ